ncbi:nicotinate-nucleotide diphosphorylase (carboxylating), partial [Kickxella alabastrina]
MSKFAALLPPTFTRTIEAWLAEDIPSFDYGGFVVGDAPKTATLYCKSPGVLSGIPFFNEVFRQTGCSVTWDIEEGAEIVPQEGKVSVAK